MKVRKNIVKFLLGIVISSQLIFSPLTVYADPDTTVDTGSGAGEAAKAQSALCLSDEQVAKMKAVWEYLQSLGYHKGAAAGILGNIYCESRCNVSALEAKINGYSLLDNLSNGDAGAKAARDEMRSKQGWGLFQLSTHSNHLAYTLYGLQLANLKGSTPWTEIAGDENYHAWQGFLTSGVAGEYGHYTPQQYFASQFSKKNYYQDYDIIFWGNWNGNYDGVNHDTKCGEIYAAMRDAIESQDLLGKWSDFSSILPERKGDYYYMRKECSYQASFFVNAEKNSYSTYAHTVENYIKKQNEISGILQFTSDSQVGPIVENINNLNLTFFKQLDGSDGAAYAGAIFAMCCERSGLNDWINGSKDSDEIKRNVATGFCANALRSDQGGKNVSRVFSSQLMYTLMEHTPIQAMDSLSAALSCASYEIGLVSEDDFAKEMKLSEKDWEAVIANANIENFSNAQLTELVDWQQRIDNNDKDIIDWARIAVAAIGTLLIFWGIIMYLSYWFDTVNTLFPIDLMPIVSLGKLEVLNSDETTFSLTKGAEKGQKVTVNHKNVATISLLLVGAGVIILSGVLYQLITMIYTFAKTKLQS